MADPATMCGGKYALAAEIVDHAHGQYETLYSGGNHWQRLDNVAPTLDAYRLFRGYPDIKLRAKFTGPGWDNDWDEDPEYRFYWWNGRDPERIWRQMSWAVRRDAPLQPDTKQVFWAGFGWDIMTAGDRERPGWWRTVKPADDAGPGVQWLIAKARTEPALDWMQTVLAGSNTPWANNWLPFANVKTSTLAGFQSLATTAFARYEAGEGVEWLVAAAINAPNIDSVPRLSVTLDKLAQDVAACAATPAGYGAYASSRLAMERNAPTLAHNPASFEDMPPRITSYARMRTVHLAMVSAAQNPTEGRRLAAALAPQVQSAEQSFALLQFYVAKTIDEAPLVVSPKMMRAYNVLSADHLAVLGKRAPGSLALINAAFSRHVALGNNAKAVALLADIKTASPEQAAAIDRIWQGRQPEAVRLALIVLAAPGISAFVQFDSANGMYDGDYALAINGRYYESHRNLPPQYREIDFLQRDFEVELRLPQRMGAYHTVRGYTIDWMERLKERVGYGSRVANDAPQLFDPSRREELPFEALIARSELRRLTGEQRLMTTVTSRLIPWARSISANGPDRELAADALAKVIRICKFNNCGEIAGRPAQRVAFGLLKGPMGGTAAAKRTKVWWPSPEDD